VTFFWQNGSDGRKAAADLNKKGEDQGGGEGDKKKNVTKHLLSLFHT
jgi:hypothetical protein